jgi:hypothetical protein
MTNPNPQPHLETTTFCCEICPAWNAAPPDPYHERWGQCQIGAPHVGSEMWPSTKPNYWCLDGADMTGWERVLMMGVWVFVPVLDDEEDADD